MMKRYITLCALAVMAVMCCMAQTDGNRRVVLKAARQFTSVAVAGPAVVELKYDPHHGGYIYYHTSDNKAPRITAKSYDGDVLRIEADSTANALATRITVLYDRPLSGVVTTDRAIVVAKDLISTQSVALSVSADRNKSGIYIKQINCANVSINLNGGDMGIARVTAHNVMVNGTDDANLRLVNCRAANLEVNGLDSSQLTIGGKVRNMMVNVDNSSAVHTTKLQCSQLTVNVQGNGELHAATAHRLVLNQLGNGKVIMPKYPREVESNVGYDAIQIDK